MVDPFGTYQRITGGGTYQDLLDSITRANYANLTPVQPAGLESLIDTYTFGLTPTFGSFPSLEESFGALEDVEDVDITDEYGDADIDDMSTSGDISRGIGSLNLGNLTAKDIALGLALGVPGIVGLVSKATTGKTISQHVVDLGRSMLGLPSGKTFGIEDNPSDFGVSPSLSPPTSGPPGVGPGESGLSAPTSGPPGVGPGESGGDSDTGSSTTGPSPGDAPPGVGPGDGTGQGGDAGSGGGGESGGDSGDTGGPFAEGGIVRRRFR